MRMCSLHSEPVLLACYYMNNAGREYMLDAMLNILDSAKGMLENGPNMEANVAYIPRTHELLCSVLDLYHSVQYVSRQQ